MFFEKSDKKYLTLLFIRGSIGKLSRGQAERKKKWKTFEKTLKKVKKS